MKYAVISDIHANLQALETALRDARREGVQQIVCLGDVVGYGPLPAQTLRRVRESAHIVLAGNHDDAVSGRISGENFIDLAADAVQRHREALSEGELDWLRHLPYAAELEGAVAAHGDFTDPPAFNYVMDTDGVKANLAATAAQLMFVGHTHVPGVYLVGRSGKIYRIDPEDFTLEDHKRYIVNPGSVGYPREAHGECFSSYVIYDSSVHTIRFRMLPFAVSSVMQRGRNPKTVKRRVVIGAVAAAAMLSGLGAYLLATGGERVVERATVIEKTVYEDDPALTVMRKSLTLPKSAKSVRAGYRLGRGSVLADLHVVFRGADGGVIQALKSTPKQSANQLVKIPAGAVSADFVVRRRQRGEQPQIKAFKPNWE